MNRSSHDPSFEHEPHFTNQRFELDPTEAGARDPRDIPAVSDVDHNVWEEPSLSRDLAGEAGEGQVTYERWLDSRIAATSYGKSLATTLLLIACAGPCGVAGAILGGGGGVGEISAVGLVMLAVIGPVTEEITKIALPLWVVEKRPFLFKSMWQILACCAAGGLLFGVIENLIYLNVYIPSAPETLTAWRWKYCTGLHVGCSFVAGVGAARIWDDAMRQRRRPRLALGMAYFATAMAGHGLYNFGVTVAELSGALPFK